ncbi:hypothetical protein KUC_2891 [Vreelandella boliviensis LC1]|uniref:Uncharacterized protein n=1 Tax=Vreelandella boliviensis LC1 TaxID=1072583 RepID=A0A7U9C164_9GAMM|nr:hypothetical protein KUC_2890 [Halomonas boliviensis LC1]EHJ92929.1 hypothetical protein KUC_2891 [Halomonas boliviensis LC1]
MVEQLTFNQLVAGSNPARPTIQTTDQFELSDERLAYAAFRVCVVTSLNE